MKFCKDCKYSEEPHWLGSSVWLCKKKEAVCAVNLISGTKEYHSCETMRNEIEPCGESARLFEGKIPKWFDFLKGV